LFLAYALGSLQAAAQQSQPVIYLNQGWSQADREWYYNFFQGSTVMPYDIVVNLEVAGGRELFRSNANLERFGLVPQGASSMNPDAFPIGVARGRLRGEYLKGEPPGEYVGLTCAACHNAELHYQGKRIRIDGGYANTFDLISLIRATADALQATLNDPAKFDRLAARLKASGDAKAKLRTQLETNAARAQEFSARTRHGADGVGPAHVCVQIINPDGLRNQIEGNVVQTVSRTLIEKLTFSRSAVTSLDWGSYPIVAFPGVPDVAVELVDRRDEVPWGAGEPTTAVVPAAIANAVFDATGARLRSVPFRPETVLAALGRVTVNQ
jgi:hypothetical protein